MDLSKAYARNRCRRLEMGDPKEKTEESKKLSQTTFDTTQEQFKTRNGNKNSSRNRNKISS